MPTGSLNTKGGTIFFHKEKVLQKLKGQNISFHFPSPQVYYHKAEIASDESGEEQRDVNSRNHFKMQLEMRMVDEMCACTYMCERSEKVPPRSGFGVQCLGDDGEVYRDKV